MNPIGEEQTKLGIRLGELLRELWLKVAEEHPEMDSVGIFAVVGTLFAACCVLHPEWAVGLLRGVGYPLEDEGTQKAMAALIEAIPLQQEQRDE